MIVESCYLVRSEHKDYISASLSVDFGELWLGSSDEKAKKNKNWSGGFSGRPGLADDIFPAIKTVAISRRPQAIQGLLHELRSFWRFLDSFEKNPGDLEVVEKVDSVARIETIHGLRWQRPTDDSWNAPRPEKYRSILLILQMSRRSFGLIPLYWPTAKNSDRVRRVDTPSKAEGLIMIRILTRRAHAIWKRWNDADSMAEQGEILLGCSKEELLTRAVTVADIHATYREVIKITNDPAPIMSEVARIMGLSKQLPRWWPKNPPGHPREGKWVNIQNDLLPGLYPTGQDIYCLALLFMARSGWNPTTVFALDCSTDQAWCRPYGEDHVWILSYKGRGSEWQDTVSPVQHSSHCFQIINRLIERTRPLRRKIQFNASRSNLPEVAARSPWLSVKDSLTIRVLSDENLPRLREFLSGLIQDHNELSSEKLPSFRPSDFRDVFAEAAHRGGGYSIFLTQIALGHKNINTTRRYLRSLAWRKESEKDLNNLINTVFDQVEVHRVIDFPLLRARMDGVNVTDEQVSRLVAYRKNRTYSGLGCSTPFSPPESIDPLHPQDGKAICAQGHRCASCPRGVVFKESLHHLAKCLAELEWKRDNVGDVRWYESTDSVDMEVIQATLKQWPETEVFQAVSHWKCKIKTGEHRVLFSAGIH
ncbi:hypothetical protein [Pseudomonas fluorescens]|uniref:hypothetical protein n=1 Tax=Pseudomonas fluorescens TaxID=294 RepID=UPI0011AFA33E|nr:hypothetical protein [Pseudomonas fluorescens]